MRYECPNCKKVISVGNLLLGKELICPICKCAVSALSIRTAKEQQQVQRQQIELRRQRRFNFCLVPILVVTVIVGISYVIQTCPPITTWSIFQTTESKPEVTKSRPEPRSESSRDESTNDVPEPSTLVLLAVVALGLAGYAWRKQRRDVYQIG